MWKYTLLQPEAAVAQEVDESEVQWFDPRFHQSACWSVRGNILGM